MPKQSSPKPTAQPSIFNLLKPYWSAVLLLAILTLSANGLTLWVPKIISHAIDGYVHQTLNLSDVGWELGLFSLGIFLLVYIQNVVQIIVSERVAKDLRNKVSAKTSLQDFTYVQKVTPSKLLTNLTSDIDAVKSFVAQAVSSLISSIALIIGASTLLLIIDWKLGLAVLTIVPLIAGFFFYSLQKVRAYFLKGRTIVDQLNKVINESILGAALIRVLHTQEVEQQKFSASNGQARDIGLEIVKVFSSLIPVIGFIANIATLIIVSLGGYFVINGQLSLGDFTAFSSYIGILIFPIIILGFISNMIAQAGASYGRVMAVLDAPDEKHTGSLTTVLQGAITADHLTIQYGQKMALQDISFTIKPGSRTAIIGPTAAGKTQLLYILMGLLEPTSGQVQFDGHPIAEYDQQALYQHIGFVFQDSIMFNITIKENIAFNTQVSGQDLDKAIATAELTDFIASLPDGLNTMVSERGASLSGGQKQRIMLARALAIDPTILFLDDFTARVDTVTETKILHNLKQNYPNLTLLSVTQKIASVTNYDQVLLLMEGELLAIGTHQQLLKSSPEYMQIYSTQQSVNSYELHPE
jgi:ATP-binding cassette subfamily B protein